MVPRRRGPRATHPRLHPLERRGRWSCGPTRPPTASAVTSRPSQLRRALRGRLQPLLPRQGGRHRRATTSTSRATPRRASTPGPSSRAACPRRTSTASAARSTCPAAGRRPGPVVATRTRGSCPTSGSTRPCRWASVRSCRSTRPGSTGTCTTVASTTRQQPGVVLRRRRRDRRARDARRHLDAPPARALDNLTWVVNCNLQRLDGPVRGNGKVIQELEAIFRGTAGTSSRSCGAPAGTSCSRATSTACC